MVLHYRGDNLSIFQELAAESFEAPVWVMKMLITIVMLGFLPVLLFSWAYEITPEGIKHERDVIRDESIANLTARKLDYLTLVAVLCVVVLIVWQTFGATILRWLDMTIGICVCSDYPGPGFPNIGQ